MSNCARRSKGSRKDEETRDNKTFQVRYYFSYVCLIVSYPSIFEFSRISLISAYLFTLVFHEGLNRLRTG